MSHKIYFTPGPAQLFYTFEEHLKNALKEDIPSISHRSKQFVSALTHTKECLRELLDVPTGYDIFFINSANEAWDRIIQNLVIHSSHHLVNGSFSSKFHEFALMHGMQSSATRVVDGGDFTSFRVPEEAELIGLTKNETSVGYSFLESEIEQIRLENPEKLIALDMVSAAPSVPISLQHVDTAYLSVQKAFGLPPGLGVWICNERCFEKAAKKAEQSSLGSYRTLSNLKKFGDKNQTPETPNMLFIYLLGKIAEDILAVGKRKVINDTVYKSTILYQAIQNHPSLTPFVKSEKHRSKTTIVSESTNAKEMISAFEKKGMVLGNGYGPHKDQHIRIANFPTHSKESVEMLCDLLEH